MLEENVLATRNEWKNHMSIPYPYAFRSPKNCAERRTVVGTVRKGSESAVVDSGFCMGMERRGREVVTRNWRRGGGEGREGREEVCIVD